MDAASFLLHIRSFTNISDTTAQSDAQILRWVYMAETNINGKLRVGDMVQIDEATIATEFRVPAPTDFIAADFFYDQTDAQPLLFKPRDEFYRFTDDEKSGWFTKSGDFLIFAPDTEGHVIELHYFGDCPHLDTDATFLSARYNSLLTAATMAVAAIAMKDFDEATRWELSKDNQINELNIRYQLSLAGGNRLTRRMRGFG